MPIITRTTRILISLPLIFLFTAVQSFGQGKGRIEGSLADTSAKAPVVYATVTVFVADDTTVVTYRLSDETGRFRTPGLPLNQKLRAVISATGYEVFRREFTLTEAAPDPDWGKIGMKTSVIELDDVLVIAERPPVVVRKDTIEFNAASFKTLPTALVEDLLKKFPGVEVDREGNITVNGRKVTRMLVEGKEFFGSDPKIASKNLPANLIDKVQVTDDKEQMLQDPNLAAGDVGQVINLKLKKGIKQGWFGKVYAGAGTRDRFETGGIFNLFRDTLQVSLLGFSNNLSRSGFGLQDIMNIGGFNRSDINSMSVGSNGSLSLNDISFGGMGQGIQTSTGAGINVNTVLNKKSTLGLQYFYGDNRSKMGNRSSTDQFLSDTVLNILNQSEGSTRDLSHRFSAFLKSKVDSFTIVEFRPSFAFIDKKSVSNWSTSSGTNFDPQINVGTNRETVKADNISMRQSLSINRSFRKKGRTLFFTASLDYNQNASDQYNDAENYFYKSGTSTILNQYREQDQSRTNWSVGFNYTEPLSARWSLLFTERLNSLASKDYVDTYQFDPSSGMYSIPDASRTNGLRRGGYRSVSTAAATYRIKKWTITPGANLYLLDIDNKFRKDPAIKQNFEYLLPSLNIRWDKYSFNYSVSAAEPAVADLQPTVNNTNPLFITLGNPSLKPSISHSGSFNAFINNVKRLVTLNINLTGRFTDNAVIQQRTVNEDGVQVTRPINVNGVKSFSVNSNLAKQFRFNKLTRLSTSINLHTSYSRSLMEVNGIRNTTSTIYVFPSFTASLNYNDKIELSQRYTPTYSGSSYQKNLYPGLSVWRHSTNTELVLRMPKKIIWETNITYIYNPQVAPGISKTALRVNAGVNLLMFKEDKGQLKLSVFDLLNQNIAVSRTIRENFIQDSETLILKRYLLLTFTYSIRTFGGKVGGSNRLLMF